MSIPAQPKIYHIVHEDRLQSIINDGFLWCDATIVAREQTPGTTIGMNAIKQRRLRELTLKSHPSLYVGACVPFYFCPRSIMLYLLHKGNHEDLQYQGGQEPIVHLEADLLKTVAWAKEHDLRWAFTLSNAGARYFEDRADLSQLDQIKWEAVEARDWRDHKEGKQAEFLVEKKFPWELVERVGVLSNRVQRKVIISVQNGSHRPRVEPRPDWYY